jgi:hypothetical protein
MWLERALASGSLSGSDRAKSEIDRMSELVEEAIVEASAANVEETLTFMTIQRGYARTFLGDFTPPRKPCPRRSPYFVTAVDAGAPPRS